MDALSLYRSGNLQQAINALGDELRKQPLDAKRRTFLFELLCFAGEYGRAEKHLDILSDASSEAAAGAMLYRSALHAEQIRQEMFVEGRFPSGPAPRAVSGRLNGTPFKSFTDADPRIGARLEVYAAGQYTWIPFEQIASVRMKAPSRLRDLLWAPATVRTSVDFKGVELGEVLIPVLAPLTWHDDNDAVRLGRVTEWRDLGDGTDAPIGQKLLLVDGEEFPMLELRELDIVPATVPVS